MIKATTPLEIDKTDPQNSADLEGGSGPNIDLEESFFAFVLSCWGALSMLKIVRNFHEECSNFLN